MGKDQLKIIIIGGGPVGLAAAHALHLAGIDFELLERRAEIVEDLGASLVISPATLRVFHQFGPGVLEHLLAVGGEITHHRSYDRQGNIFYDSWLYSILRKNHGMVPVAFHRAHLVQILFERLPQAAKSKIHLGKKLSEICPDDEGVTVICDDGSSYRGSLVLGADGNHSKTRQLMRQLALKEKPSRPWDTEKPFIATYSCLWCSFPRPSEPGQSFETQHKDRSVMYISGRSRSWIFLYRKLPKKTNERVTYTESDIEACAKEFADFPIADNLSVKDVWASRLTAGMSNLDEGIANNWTWGGRIVLVGDAAHKFTPNSGQGLNAGIPDVVRLCNGLHSLQATLAASPTPASKQGPLLAEVLESYEKERRASAHGEISRAASLTRMHSWANPLYYFFARYVMSLQVVTYLIFQTAARWNISRGLILDNVEAEEPFKGAVAWKYPMKGTKKEKAA